MIALLTAWVMLLLGGSPTASTPSTVSNDTLSRVLSELASPRVVVHPERGEIVIDVAPVDLPASDILSDGHAHGTHPPVALAVLPTSGALYGFRAEVVDSLGRPLPSELIHHVNVIEPDRRELFLPISRRFLAAGRETGSMALPWVLFGVPFERGQRLLVTAMLHNPLDQSFAGARVRVVLLYTPAGRPWPFFRGSPFQLDVAFPVGDKSFDLPPGRSSRSYEASPAIPGTIVAIGGHMHDYGVSIELANAVTGEVIWRAEPQRDSLGRLQSIPVGRLYGMNRLGALVSPAERYRVTVVYENPTGRTLPAGGMGVVGGLFVPADTVTWPGVDRTSELYQRDLLHATRNLTGIVATDRGRNDGRGHGAGGHGPDHGGH